MFSITRLELRSLQLFYSMTSNIRRPLFFLFSFFWLAPSCIHTIDYPGLPTTLFMPAISAYYNPTFTQLFHEIGSYIFETQLNAANNTSWKLNLCAYVLPFHYENCWIIIIIITTQKTQHDYHSKAGCVCIYIWRHSSI